MHGRWIVAALLLTGCAEPQAAGFSEPIGGCGDRPTGGSSPDWSKETIDYYVLDGTARVPVVLSPHGSTMDDWSADLRGTEAKPVQTSRGPALEVAGDAHLLACSIQPAAGGNGCCAEQFLDGRWSLGPKDTRPSTIWVEIVTGPATIDIAYAAVSDLCGREASFHGQGLDVGWQRLTGEDAAWCA